jgi:hypothetical protein
MPAMVIVMGGGCRPGALAWFQAHCDSTTLIAVYALEDFIGGAMRAERGALVLR